MTLEGASEIARKGLALRIGCHSDILWHLDAWRRHPEICRSVCVKEECTRIASPHGGLIYIEVPRGLTREEISVFLRGGVPAPRFVLGKTSSKDWKKKIRKFPAPWAEMETSRIILTVPSSSIRKLDDPVPLMEFWNEVLGCYAELGMRPLPRRPQAY